MYYSPLMVGVGAEPAALHREEMRDDEIDLPIWAPKRHATSILRLSLN